MKQINPKAASRARLRGGRALLAALRHDPPTETIASAFAPTQQDLVDALAAREAAEDAEDEANVVLDLANFHLDTFLRMLARHVEIADERPQGPRYQSLFPNGLVALTLPQGARQLTVLDAFIRDFELNNAPGIEALRAEHLASLSAARDTYAQHVAARDAARAAVAAAWAVEYAARQDHVYAIDRVMNELRLLFPRDRARQDLYFRRVHTSRRPAAIDDPFDAGDGPDSGGAEGEEG